ncbi:hypothetical protein LZ32DRAFT_620404 [Colletotrichum eremochloae]|nr:hypothetical protein LZ32DRAFT_620404 [Colletotrichum eremochloae]
MLLGGGLGWVSIGAGTSRELLGTVTKPLTPAANGRHKRSTTTRRCASQWTDLSRPGTVSLGRGPIGAGDRVRFGAHCRRDDGMGFPYYRSDKLGRKASFSEIKLCRSGNLEPVFSIQHTQKDLETPRRPSAKADLAPAGQIPMIQMHWSRTGLVSATRQMFTEGSRTHPA